MPSHSKVNWVCNACGHRWVATISDRVRGNGCPACSRRVATKGKNDIATVFPQIAAEWNYERNDPLVPEEMLPGSSSVVWWKCRTCGGEWKASIENRCTIKAMSKDGSAIIERVSSKTDNGLSGHDRINFTGEAQLVMEIKYDE